MRSGEQGVQHTQQDCQRAQHHIHTHTSLLEKSFLGIDYIVNPELEAAKEIISKIEHGATGDIMLFENTSLQIRTVPVPEDSVFAGRLVKNLHTVLAARVLVALIYQDGQ